MQHKHVVMRCNCPPCGYALGRGVVVREKEGRRTFYCFKYKAKKVVIQQELLFFFFSDTFEEVQAWGMSWRTSSKHLVVIFTPQCHEMSARQCYWFPFLQMWQLMWTAVQNCILLEELSMGVNSSSLTTTLLSHHSWQFFSQWGFTMKCNTAEVVLGRALAGIAACLFEAWSTAVFWLSD